MYKVTFQHCQTFCCLQESYPIGLGYRYVAVCPELKKYAVIIADRNDEQNDKNKTQFLINQNKWVKPV